MEGDVRLANILKSCIDTAEEAYMAADKDKANDRLSYLLGSLQTALELIRPEEVGAEPRKSFLRNLLP